MIDKVIDVLLIFWPFITTAVNAFVVWNAYHSYGLIGALIGAVSVLSFDIATSRKDVLDNVARLRR